MRYRRGSRNFRQGGGVQLSENFDKQKKKPKKKKKQREKRKGCGGSFPSVGVCFKSAF